MKYVVKTSNDSEPYKRTTIDLSRLKYIYDTPVCEHCESQLELRCLKKTEIIEYNFRRDGKNNWIVVSSWYVTCVNCRMDSDLRTPCSTLILLSGNNRINYKE